MTIFGPGAGESIILHLGNDDWVVIDSCILPDEREPAALSYLRSIGKDPATCVRRVLITHWHDDHIRGAAKILDSCPNAGFAMSTALAQKEFVELVLEVREQNKFIKQTSTAHELADILEILEMRASGSHGRSPDIFAHDGTRIFHGGFQDSIDVWAMSPSAASIKNSHIELANRILAGTSTRVFKKFSPNDLSVAVLVDAPQFSLLLGADLENTTDAQFGWKALLRSENVPKRKSFGIKVAHHGSENGDHEGIWKDRLVLDPFAFITPYVRLNNPLPTADDVMRIKSRSQKVYCTTWPVSGRPPRRPGVDGIVQGATVQRRGMNRNTGHLRLRADLSESPIVATVERFGSAAQL